MSGAPQTDCCEVKINRTPGFTIREITNFTFLVAFLALTFSTILTGVGAFRSNDTKYEIALTLETFISAVAGYVYYKYLIDKKSEQEITPYRYLDWLITTPFLLLSLMVILNDNNPQFPWYSFLWVVILDLIMLISGYLSEIGKLDRFLGWLVGTIALIGIFLVLGYTYPSNYNQPIFWYFVILWVLYGVVFYLPGDYKTICYNILDVAAKVAFGIWTWFLSVGL